MTLAACILWAIGALYSRDADLPASPLLVAAIQMLAGGVALLALGIGLGEWQGFDPRAVSATSLLAFAYLVVFGSLIAFSAFSWLIRNTEPTLVSTHTYVNPVVAVFLGWLVVGEPVGPRTILASTLIVGAVFLVTTSSMRRRKKPTMVRSQRERAEPLVETGERLERCA